MSKAELDSLLAAGLKLHQESQLARAESVYREVLGVDPGHADALHLLGLLRGHAGHLAEAIELVERAIRRNPTYSAYQNNLGNLLKKHGEAARAQSAYRQAIRLDRKNAEAYLNLGKLLDEEGDSISARDCFVSALRLAPGSLEGQMSLGCLEEKAGNFAGALDRFRKAVEIGANHAPAYLMMAKCWYAEGDLAQGEACLVKAIELEPNYADAYFNLGNLERSRNRLQSAVDAYWKAIELAPMVAGDAYNNLGLTFAALGRSEDAMGAYLKAISLRPAEDTAYYNLGKLRLSVRDEKSAAELFRRVVTLNPANAAAHVDLALLHERANDLDEATRLYRRASELEPGSPVLRIALAAILTRQGDAEGLSILEDILLQQPLTAETHYQLYVNLGIIRKNQGHLQQAIECYREAAKIPNGARPELENNLGIALALLGLPEGIRMLEKLIRKNPLSAATHFNLGVAYLLNNQYEAGWPEFEWWRKVDQLKKDAIVVNLPRWQGEPLEGKSILLYAEQGFGDTLQFLRYVPLVAARGGRVVLAVQPALYRLVKDLPDVSLCLALGGSFPACDVAMPLMSLPRIFGTRADSVPPPAALMAPLGTCDADALDEPYKIGLVWAGNPKHTMDRLRSMSLADFGILAGLEHVAFTSLQLGAAVEQITRPAQPICFAADCSAVKDFADTAAIIADLDLVVTIDSAVAHLAGSLGKPVWILNACVPDWRWGRESFESPWYPTARLFRQAKPGDWSGVMRQVCAQLTDEVEQHRQAKQHSHLQPTFGAYQARNERMEVWTK